MIISKSWKLPADTIWKIFKKIDNFSKKPRFSYFVLVWGKLLSVIYWAIKILLRCKNFVTVMVGCGKWQENYRLTSPVVVKVKFEGIGPTKIISHRQPPRIKFGKTGNFHNIRNIPTAKLGLFTALALQLQQKPSKTKLYQIRLLFLLPPRIFN